MNRIFVFLFFLSIKCFSQETKLVIYGNNHFNKEFYVLKSDENIKHGPFLWYTFVDKTINLLESGNYSYGKKDGQWDYFYGTPVKTQNTLLTNNLKERVFYRNGIKEGAWTSFHLDTIQTDMRSESYKPRKKSDSTVINLSIENLTIRLSGQYQNDMRVGEWSAFDHSGVLIQLYDFDQSKLLFDKSVDSIMYTGTRPALFLGGETELRQFIFESFNPEISERMGRDSTRLVAEFVIKGNGNVDQLNVIKGRATKDAQLECFRIIGETSGHWLPALNDGEPIDSRKILAIDVLVLKRKWNSVQYRLNVSVIN